MTDQGSLLDVGLDVVTHLLCDADGTLFASEEPAYAASADVTNRFLKELGADRAYDATELQSMTNGKNFRGSATELATRFGRPLDGISLDDWVLEEMDVVTAHLREILRPDPSVSEAVALLGKRYVLAAVTSSAGPRLDACLEVTDLAASFPPDSRFSAETSLPSPVSKPDPAVYVHAAERLGIGPEQGLAIEDSVNGATAAIAAGIPTIGLLQFVPAAQRAERAQALTEAGVAAVVGDWPALVDLLS
jgi:HAD superfamily hydrolase (TIGR01509 family)